MLNTMKTKRGEPKFFPPSHPENRADSELSELEADRLALLINQMEEDRAKYEQALKKRSIEKHSYSIHTWHRPPFVYGDIVRVYHGSHAFQEGKG